MPAPLQGEEGVLHDVLGGAAVVGEQYGQAQQRQALGPVEVDQGVVPCRFGRDRLVHRTLLPRLERDQHDPGSLRRNPADTPQTDYPSDARAAPEVVTRPRLSSDAWRRPV